MLRSSRGHGPTSGGSLLGDDGGSGSGSGSHVLADLSTRSLDSNDESYLPLLPMLTSDGAEVHSILRSPAASIRPASRLMSRERPMSVSFAAGGGLGRTSVGGESSDEDDGAGPSHRSPGSRGLWSSIVLLVRHVIVLAVSSGFYNVLSRFTANFVSAIVCMCLSSNGTVGR